VAARAPARRHRAAALPALVWTALKVGALSYGGGFVIVPLMQGDALAHDWLTSQEFANAVAYGQITPGPVTHTIAFAPSFAFVMLGGDRFEAIRGRPGPRAFLDGAGPAAIGAILGSAIPLARALGEPWQFAVLAAAAVALLVLRRGVVVTLVAAGIIGAVVAVAGGPIPG